MRVLKWLFWISVWAVVLGFLHYTLPQKDVVQIVGTDIRRTDVGDRPLFWARPDSGQAALDTRDVRFIRALYQDGDTMEYRNEDTGFGWPPYFKFDADELQTRAAVAAREQEGWFAVSRYGLRSNLLTIYPNALSIRPVAGPDAFVISWTRWIVLVLVVMVLWFLTTRWIRFKQSRISPVLDDIDARWDARRMRWERQREQRRAERVARGE